MSNKVAVKKSEIEISGATTHIKSHALVDALIQDKADTVAGLSNLVAPLDPKSLHVDNQGRLQINDAAFAKALAGRLSGKGALADNGVCNGGGCAAAHGITAASRPE